MPLSPEYRAYLASEQWQRVRRAALSHAGYRCARCQARSNPRARIYLEVHHLTYERLGRERLEDLEVLCTNCHDG